MSWGLGLWVSSFYRSALCPLDVNTQALCEGLGVSGSSSQPSCEMGTSVRFIGKETEAQMRPHRFSKDAWIKRGRMSGPKAHKLSCWSQRCPSRLCPSDRPYRGQSILIRQACSCAGSCLAPCAGGRFQRRIPQPALGWAGGEALRDLSGSPGSSGMGSAPEFQCHRYYCFI